ncbi:hypothetical protein KKG05_08400 [bacterium]|nr:hypothetical protein [bacterium]
MGDFIESYLSLLVEEYRSLRDESKQISINMFTALKWGAAFLSVLIAAGFTLWNKQHGAVLVIFYLLIPLLSGISMMFWLGEASRYRRVGRYLCFVEQKAGLIISRFSERLKLEEHWKSLQEKLEEDLDFKPVTFDMSHPLCWEHWLRNSKHGHQAFPYSVRASLFIVIMLLSWIIATYYTLAHPRYTSDFLLSIGLRVPSPNTSALWLTVLSFIAIVIFIVIGCWQMMNLWYFPKKNVPIFRTKNSEGVEGQPYEIPKTQ